MLRPYEELDTAGRIQTHLDMAQDCLRNAIKDWHKSRILPFYGIGKPRSYQTEDGADMVMGVACSIKHSGNMAFVFRGSKDDPDMLYLTVSARKPGQDENDLSSYSFPRYETQSGGKAFMLNNDDSDGTPRTLPDVILIHLHKARPTLRYHARIKLPEYN